MPLRRDGGDSVWVCILQGPKGSARGTPVLGDFPGVAAEHLGARGATAISVVPKSSAKHGDGV